MTTAPHFGPMLAVDELAVARLVSLAFGGTPAGATDYLRTTGREHLRVLRQDGAPAACLATIPMGQYFGGRSIPMTGIAAVAVAPEARGSGLALHLMRAALRELHAAGVPLSGLYASTQTLYRQVGFEQAGHCFRIRLPLARLGIRDRSMHLRRAEPADEPAIRACYADMASRFDGPLDRGPYVWNRLRAWRDTTFEGWLVSHDASGPIEGYIFLAQTRKDSGKYDLTLSDLAFTTPRAGRRLLGFLADFATMGDDAVIQQAGPVHPILTLLPAQTFTVERREYSMTRVVRPLDALQARGYPAAARAAASFTLEDPTLPENSGFYTITIDSGRAAVTRDASGAGITLTPNALAALLTGFYSARQAELAGLLAGSADDIAALNAIFPGSCPWMADFF